MRTPVLLAAAVMAGLPLHAQGYRATIDSRLQSVAYRGVEVDSVLANTVDTLPGGSLQTTDGFAVTCVPGFTYCRFFRPGDRVRGSPWTTTADISAWGFGVPGLRARALVRTGIDLGTATAWSGTDPALQLLEGALEYSSATLTIEAGRTHVVSRLGYHGFDGGKVMVRTLGQRLSLDAYGGWGLDRGVALPVTSPALNPIDDYQPLKRQLLVGGGVAWRQPRLSGRLFYQREVDPRSNKFVSERAGVDVRALVLTNVTLTGGADYDLARGLWGSWELQAGFRPIDRVVQADAGLRRYRPHFDLWTIWGAFSPVPYTAAFGSVSIGITNDVLIRARGETYWYDPHEADTPVAPDADFEEAGWRWSLGLTASPHEQVVIRGDGHVEFGPGAASKGIDGELTWMPARSWYVSAHASRLERPLEFRFNAATVWSYGVQGSAAITERLAFDLGVTRYDESRDRPDAAAFAWDQWRLRAGLRLTLGAAPRAAALPPAVLQIPSRTRGAGSR